MKRYFKVRCRACGSRLSSERAKRARICVKCRFGLNPYNPTALLPEFPDTAHCDGIVIDGIQCSIRRTGKGPISNQLMQILQAVVSQVKEGKIKEQDLPF